MLLFIVSFVLSYFFNSDAISANENYERFSASIVETATQDDNNPGQKLYTNAIIPSRAARSLAPIYSTLCSSWESFLRCTKKVLFLQDFSYLCVSSYGNSLPTMSTALFSIASFLHSGLPSPQEESFIKEIEKALGEDFDLRSFKGSEAVYEELKLIAAKYSLDALTLSCGSNRSEGLLPQALLRQSPHNNPGNNILAKIPT